MYFVSYYFIFINNIRVVIKSILYGMEGVKRRP